jgi:alpha-2-macroglobulin
MQLKRFFGIAMLLVATSVLFCQCTGRKKTGEIIDPAYNPYISAFTSGVISSTSSITIVLSEDYQGEVALLEPIRDKLFEFSPSIKGTAYWTNSRTIEFKPDERLPNGKTFNVRFFLGKLKEVPKELATFDFSFQTMRQSFNVDINQFEPLDPADGIWNRLGGLLVTADVMEQEQVAKLLKATQGRRELKITWEQQMAGTSHAFLIDSVQRLESKTQVVVSWDGKPAGLDIKDEMIVEIPAIGDFTIMEVRTFQQPEQYISVRFSDPVRKDLDLSGLIRLQNVERLRFLVDGNEVRVFPEARISGTRVLTVEEGIRSQRGYRLGESQNFNLAFEDIKPLVRLVGKGVIIPDSDGLVFPFEAVNLRAVEVRIIKIFESNVGQFLQVNQIDGESQLKRAGRLILQRTIPLSSDRPIDYGRWNTFSFDLSKLISTEPGAIYRVEIGFRREHSSFPCPGDTGEQTLSQMGSNDREKFEKELEYWDTPDGYWDSYSYHDYYYEEDYNWEERENPCNDAYYGRRRSVSRNVLASDLGIIAKGGTDQSMLFAVTDLRTTNPLSSVTLELYSYQNKLITTVITDRDGLARVIPEQRPYLLIAKQGQQRGYLRLDDGSSLSLSRFDISGNVVQRGLKGFIYGERGVWRPGDSLFVMFVLEDKLKQLPANHPVSFELYNPMGQLVQRMTRTSGNNGFYNFSTATPPDAPTGNWSGRVSVGGTTFSRIFKIETVKPNRLKISIDFGADRLSVDRPDLTGNLKVNWLHGAPARSLRAHVAVTLNQMRTQFERYRAFTFDDPARTFSTEEVTIFDAKISEEGEASIKPTLSVKSAAPGMLSAGFVVRVFEEGGDFSIDRFSLPYSPYKHYVGIKVPEGDRYRGMLVNNTDHKIEIATVDANGNPVSRRNLEVNIYKVEWRWWWDASEENLASYMGSPHNRPIQTLKVSTTNGAGSFNFKIPHPEWGRFLIRITDPESGHSTGKTVYVDWPGWSSRAAASDPQAAAMLSFSSDKEKYQVGEQVRVTVPASSEGRALVSVESGSKVVDAFWVESKGNETQFSFTATQAMAPNVYVHVTMVQPHAQTANDLPIRMYGVIPVAVEDPATRLSPQIEMAGTLKPEENATIKVKEATGKRMTYTLAIVDEGLLDLTRFATPNPWTTFYAREALGVKTWDMYDYVLGAYGGRIERIFSLGGDEEIVGKTESQANRFKPMVKFMGPFTLDRNRTNTHTFMMPQYVGSVRVMVIAGDQGAYGHAEKTVPVKKPLMVLATLPRVLTPGESVKLPVTVFAMESSVRNVKVEVQTNELLPVKGPKTKDVSFLQVGDQVVNFDLEVAKAIGIGKVKVIVSSGRERAEYDIEIDVRNPNQRISDFVEAVIDPGKEWASQYTPVGMAGTNTGVLEISSIPPVDFGRRLKYLIEYPHGCVEQVTSAAFPQLFLGTVMEMDANMRSITERNIREAIQLLGRYQLPDGGLAYWPGTSGASDWGTSYAGHFMLEAEGKGYTLPVGFKDAWIRYQRSLARDFSLARSDSRFGPMTQGDLLQAYRLYTLALAKAPEMGAMNRMRELTTLSPQARWRLAAAYALAGQPEAAAKLIDGTTKNISEYSAFNMSYGSRERDQAMIIETLVLLNRRDEAVPMMKQLSEVLTSQRWLSTQATAYSLLAISKFAGGQGAGEEMKYTYRINSGNEVQLTSRLPINQAQVDIRGASPGNVMVKNNGNTIMFVRLLLSGIPETTQMTAAQNNLQISVTYRDMAGKTMDVSKLMQGTDFLAEVTVSNPGRLGNYTDIALTQVFPSGWEIHNTRMDEFTSAHQASVPTYLDIRDDRVHTFFDLPAGQSKKFIVVLNAAYRGKFFLPGVFAEAMYNDRINARLTGQWVEVVMPGE